MYAEKIHQAVESDWERIKKSILDELFHATPSAIVTAGSGDAAEIPHRGFPGPEERGNRFTETPGHVRTSMSAKFPSQAAIGTPTIPPIMTTRPGGPGQLQSRMANYAQVVAVLNEHRVTQMPFALIGAFEEVARKTSIDGRDQQILDSWNMIRYIVNEEEFSDASSTRGGFEHMYYQDYSGKLSEISSINLRRRLIAGSRRYLERQFLKFIDLSIAQFPRESQLGGRPSIEERIRAFLNIRYAKSGGLSKSKLESVGDKPIWALMYYCMRCGEWRKVLDIAREHASYIQRLDGGFMSYLTTYIESEDRKLPRTMRQQILAEFSQISRHVQDPFKLAVYKILGRCDLNKKSIVDVIQATEDYIWLQLTLIREDVDVEESAHDRYTLRDLQDLLVRFGPEHFNSKINPFTYFQVLLLSGNFENAIAYLYNSDAYSTGAVHYAVGLAFYGLLLTGNTDMELISPNQSDVFPRHRVNFNRLLHQYTQSFAKSNPLEAVQYMFLLTMDDTPGQLQLAYRYIRDIVFETKEYALLLGEVRADGSRIPGFIEAYMRLLRFDGNLQDFLNEFVEKTALQCEESGFFEDAIQLHNLAQNYDAVVELLNSCLGSFISGIQMTKNGLSPEQISSIARSLHDYYVSTTRIYRQIQEDRWKTYETLLTLQEFFDQYRKNHFESALTVLESLDLLPLDTNRAHATYVSEKAEKFRHLDNNIVKNLSDILLTTMDSLFRLYSSLKESLFIDSARQTKMNDLRQKGRLLMTFAGMVQYRMSQETYARLSKLDIHMN